MGGSVNVDIVEIAVDVRQFHQTFVHDSEPEPGYVGKHVHTEVAVGKAWQVFEMS